MPSLFWDVTRRILVVADVSGESIFPCVTVKQSLRVSLDQPSPNTYNKRDDLKYIAADV
jgi:hypothetical protein